MENKQNLTFSRRSFLKTSALASGGMLIGFNLFNACKAEVKPPIDLSQLNYNDFNAYIKISPEGKVTIFSPNPEIGQGVKTSMPMLIAEELDVLWEDVFVVQGKLDTKNYNRQIAGGSGSIRASWKPLRETGATAKQMLINAAAAKWGISPSECSAKAGLITNDDGDTMGYGDVVLEAAALDVPENVTLKDPKDFTIIGKGKLNVDVDKIITGKPLFGLDYKEEGMLYASIIRPPAFGQILESFDATQAKALPGVVDVITVGSKIRDYENNGKQNWTLVTSNSDKVVVIAKSTWDAFKGIKAIKTTWKVDTKLESTKDHDKVLVDLLDGDKFETRRSDGDVKKALSNADKVIERTYEAPFLPHNTLEPMNFFAHVTNEKVRLIGNMQTPAAAAKMVSEVLERPIEEVSAEITRMGGGFGRRLYNDFVMEAAEIADVIRKPIKMVSSREADMTTGVYRPCVKYRFTASIKNGKLTGYHLKGAGVNASIPTPMANYFPAGAIKNYQVDAATYKSNITTGAWRAPVTHFLASAEQSFFNVLAEELQIDHVQLYLDLLENLKGVNDKRMKFNPKRMEDVIKLVVDKSHWGKTEPHVYQGFSAYFSHNTHVAEVAEIVLENGLPVVKKVTCAIDCGIVVNPLGALNQAKGGVIDGVGHAMYADFSIKNGKPQSNNFNTYQLIRMAQTPKVDVHFVQNNIAPTGLGEPTLPPVGGAIANAIYQATGARLTKQPYMANLKIAEELKV
ncbi:isoquinoline 1-oxidoreductase [Tamlana sedimentorum]|uniref:Isoquinoline 1-oxidoreductase n=1 Tax=Neotamlana sedimentorum TaxID=1435349 RepID=A0A0D7WAZ7_9FLAO|nr:molybdopterin cofactor-binding domain-containing protein [Tamlana sedimentorum]KJD36301.1 isoquinoline 1-oxidoreductase [Tamlana sedimentorum]